MQSHSTASALLPTAGLAGLAFGQRVIFNILGRWRHVEIFIPEFITLALLGGVFYLAAVYLVERYPLDSAGWNPWARRCSCCRIVIPLAQWLGGAFFHNPV